MIQDKIGLNRAKVRVAADLSAEGIVDVQREQAAEKVMADQALRQFEIDMGLATPETAGINEAQKELGPATETAETIQRLADHEFRFPGQLVDDRARRCRIGIRRGHVSWPNSTSRARSTRSSCTAMFTTWCVASGRRARRVRQPAGLSWRSSCLDRGMSSWAMTWDAACARGRRRRQTAAGDDAVRVRRDRPARHWSRDPDKVLDLLEQLIQRNLLVEDAATRKRMAFVFEHGQYLLPAGDLATLARGQAARLVRLLNWAANPYIKRLNMAFCLLTDKLSELSDRLVNNPHVATLEIRLPDVEERRRFVDGILVGRGSGRRGELGCGADRGGLGAEFGRAEPRQSECPPGQLAVAAA